MDVPPGLHKVEELTLEKEKEIVNVRTGDQTMVREVNRALILDLLRKNDVISRVQIAKTLRVSKFTVSTIVNELIEQEFVIESGKLCYHCFTTW